ncbi:MAG: DUF5655 domain-containing protein [Christensenellales bacterium]
MIYREEDGCLKELKNLNFVLEKDLQKFVERNMDTLIGYRFLETEFVANNYRFDSVAFDEDNNAFIIVEYKRGRNESLVDQGYAYLKTIIDRKADFVLLYNEKLERNRKIKDFDWSQTRVVFVSPKFTQYQIDATSFDDMPFELFEIKKYESDLYEIERINQRKSALKRNQVEKFESDTIKRVNSEIKPYDESYHLNRASEIAKELYLEIKERILDLDCDFSVVYTKCYVAFKKNSTKNVVDIWLKKDWLEIVFALKQGELIDSQNLTYDITNRQWSSEQYAMRVDKNVDISYVLELIRQTYSKK